MNKGIGFSRTILLDWLDATASLCIRNIDYQGIRESLAETISGAVTGKDAQRKTIDVLTAIWVKTEMQAPVIRQQALELFPMLITAEDRLWLHYGMTLICYPFFRNCMAAVGQISRTQDLITRNDIKDRMASEYGHLGALDRSVERVLASMMHWAVLAPTEEKHLYRILLRQLSATDELQNWLLTGALFAHPAEGLPYEDLVRLPELYPFIFTIGVDSLQRDSRFEVQRQGGGLEIVSLR